MPPHAAQPGSEPLHVSLVAIPEATVSTLSGIFDVMNSFTMMSRLGEPSFDNNPFRVEIVGDGPPHDVIGPPVLRGGRRR